MGKRPNGVDMAYLILHSFQGGAIDQPWSVIKCFHDSDEQIIMFTGPRADAYELLKLNWL